MTRPPHCPNYPFAASGAPLINDFRTFDARKTSTRRGRIGTSCPVFGLRPTRWPLSRTVKLPKDEIFTDSPRANASTTSERIVSTRSLDSLRESPTSWNTDSLKSARVIVRPSIRYPSFPQQKVALLDAAILDRCIQRQRDRGRRGIGMFIHSHHDPFRRQAELAAG